VVTIEGLGHAAAGAEARGPAGALHPVQQALVDEQAIQCGFCTPGLVIAIVALLQANARPSDDQIRTALGNICRCGVYPRLIRAVRRLTGPADPAPVPAPATAVASPSEAPDGADSPDGGATAAAD
jgi:isoquinoline 1-oxidoreductase alpha subunit